jgi:hypothetical protein
MTARTSDFQSAEAVRKVRPAQVKAEPAPPPYVGGGRCGAAAISDQDASAGPGEAGAPQRMPVNRKRSDGFDVSAFERANKRAFNRLAELADGNDELLGFLSRGLMALSLAPKRGRPKRDLIESSDKPDRDHVRDQLCRAISAASGEQRRLLTAQAAALHSAVEKVERRKVLIRQWRDRYGKGLSVHQMSQQIWTDLDWRRRLEPKSTGEAWRDQLCDKILACRFELSKRTITGDLS